MNNPVFIIDQKELFIEKTFVGEGDADIFFLCKGENDFFLVYCTDYLKKCYYIASVANCILNCMLKGIISARYAFNKAKKKYLVLAGETLEEDTVSEIGMFDRHLLPRKDCKYSELTNSLEEYATSLKSQYNLSDENPAETTEEDAV